MDTFIYQNYCKFCEPQQWFVQLYLNPTREIGNLIIPMNVRTESALDDLHIQVYGEKSQWRLPISTFLSRSVIKVWDRVVENCGRYFVQFFDSSMSTKIFLENLLEEQLYGGE